MHYHQTINQRQAKECQMNVCPYFQVNRFARCDKCTLLKERLQETRDKAKRQLLIERREKHLKKQKYVSFSRIEYNGIWS